MVLGCITREHKVGNGFSFAGEKLDLGISWTIGPFVHLLTPSNCAVLCALLESLASQGHPCKSRHNGPSPLFKVPTLGK